MQRTFVRAAITAVTLSIILATSALAAGRPDSWITLKTKLALMTTSGVDAWDTNVDTVKGAVTLHGKVDTDAAKDKAEVVARKIEGVTSVKNLLQVVPKSMSDSVEQADDAVKDAAQQALEADAALNDSGISVASVNKGVVLLSGEAKTLDVQVRAVETVRQVPGVRRVSSEMTLAGTD
jgi:hyperosmotically inducible protein